MIVLIGGFEKVVMFIFLLRGLNLNVICLLDFYLDFKGKVKMDKLIRGKIIYEKRIWYFYEFVGKLKVDIEDLFFIEDYLRLFNVVFVEILNIDFGDLDLWIDRIVFWLNKKVN